MRSPHATLATGALSTRISRRYAVALLGALAGAALAGRPRPALADSTIQGPVTIQGTLTSTDLVTAQNGVAVNGSSVQMATYPLIGGMSAPITFPSAQASWRVFLTSTNDARGNTDNQLVFAYNATKNNSVGSWNRPDVSTQPVSVFVYESFFSGNAEWNWDLAAPGAGPPQRRPWGAQFTYANDDCAFDMGISGMPSGSGGVRVNGGMVTGQLLVRSARGQGANSPVLTMQRGDGSVFFKSHPSAAAWVLTGSSTANVNGAGYYGLMHIMSTQQAFSVGGTSPSDIALQSMVEVVGGSQNDAYPRFIVNTDGTHRWGPGTTPADSKLYRSGVNSLKSDGTLALSQRLSNLPGGGRMSQGQGLPTVPNGVAPATGDIYFRTDTPNTPKERIYICITAGPTPAWTGIL